ncbi:MAG: ATP-dependent nuclease [Armatimonadota bacterium]
MRIESFTVSGFANLTRPVTLTPLEDVNALYGPNDVGKGNLLRALELYFRLMGIGEEVTKTQVKILDISSDEASAWLTSSFNRYEAAPVQLEARWQISERDLERYGLFPEHPCGTMTTGLELKSLGRAVELRVTRWLLQDKDVAQLDRTRDAALTGFAQQLRRLVSDARPFQQEQPILPVAWLGRESEEFSQAQRDALFDARQSASPGPRRRWALFAALAGTLQPELGEGSWETVYDRETGRADIVFIRGEELIRLEQLGSGLRRFAGLLAEVALAEHPVLCLEEPEWRLSPELQGRLIKLVQQVVHSGVGPRQLFLTTHSPYLAGASAAFAVDRRDGGPEVERRPWGEALAAETSAAGTSDDLGGLIGLVESLAELEPEQILSKG